MPIANQARRPFAHLLLPELRTPFLQGTEAESLAIGASFWGRPVGVAFAEVAGKEARLLDLYVEPTMRNARIGEHLLRQLEAVLTEQGCVRIEVYYQTNEWTPTFQRLLQRCGWEPPLLSRKIFWFKPQPLHRWLQIPLPPTYEIVPWRQLAEAELAQIAERGRQGDWYPPILSPFTRPRQQWDAGSSLALRRQGVVVGWMLTFMQPAGDLLYDVLFVSPELQPLGRGFMLLAEAIRIHTGYSGIMQGVCRTVPDSPMQKFIERHLVVADRGEEYICHKQLQSDLCGNTTE